MNVVYTVVRSQRLLPVQTEMRCMNQARESSYIEAYETFYGDYDSNQIIEKKIFKKRTFIKRIWLKGLAFNQI